MLFDYHLPHFYTGIWKKALMWDKVGALAAQKMLATTSFNPACN
jgi:hypothetical protein